MTPAIAVQNLSHSYDKQTALQQVSFAIPEGGFFALLGPNGSGKTTLFRILATLLPPQSGDVRIFDWSVRTQAAQVRSQLGVVFQSPSLDKKLTVRENLRCAAAMYGLWGGEARRREDQVLSSLQLENRAGTIVETLSGGLQRRVEIAKCLLTQPRLLLLDEPSTGLDPGIRAELWSMLRQLQEDRKMTIAYTTHLMEEAELADEVLIFDRGSVVASGTPDQLRANLHGEIISIKTRSAGRLAEAIGSPARVVGNSVRLESASAHSEAAALAARFATEIQSITVSKPSLEDVYISKTGRYFEETVEA